MTEGTLFLVKILDKDIGTLLLTSLSLRRYSGFSCIELYTLCRNLLFPEFQWLKNAICTWLSAWFIDVTSMQLHYQDVFLYTAYRSISWDYWWVPSSCWCSICDWERQKRVFFSFYSEGQYLLAFIWTLILALLLICYQLNSSWF